MSSLITFFLFASLALYIVSGGADFGVGIVELFSRSKDDVRRLGERAIAPIWEANHIWLIIVVVVLFVAYPELHRSIVTTLHVPLLVMLVGIILRGCAFTFRYYDVGDDVAIERVWSYVFRFGSVLVPVTFGIIVGTFFTGTLGAGESVFERYFSPWLSLFPILVGIFVAILFAWTAAQFLATQTGSPQELKRARVWSVALAIVGSTVSLYGGLSDVLASDVSPLSHPLSLCAVGVAIVGGTALWFQKPTWNIWIVRTIASVVAVSILGGYFAVTFPVVMITSTESLSAYPTAPIATLRALGFALLGGSTLIFPGLFYLYRVFGQRDLVEHES